MDQFLPQSQYFLANIILEVQWPYVPNLDLRVLLSLFIKLSNQPNMRKVHTNKLISTNIFAKFNQFF